LKIWAGNVRILESGKKYIRLAIEGCGWWNSARASWNRVDAPEGMLGYVLAGNMSVDFDGRIIDFKAGDGIDIPEGAENRHKARIARGGVVLLLLFEKM